MNAIRFSGRVRVFFNRHHCDELVWIVATPTFEIAVRLYELHGATLVSKYEPQVVPADPARRHDGPPSAWMEGDVHVEITVDGRAIITSIGTA